MILTAKFGKRLITGWIIGAVGSIFGFYFSALFD
jgi:ABC-type Mn2+/Zn2+ transport system permease subunit